jgi:hypothetical protein
MQYQQNNQKETKFQSQYSPAVFFGNAAVVVFVDIVYPMHKEVKL